MQKKRQIQFAVRDRMNSICPMNFFRTTDTTDTTDTSIWKPGFMVIYRFDSYFDFLPSSKSCCGTISKACERDKRRWHRNGVATFIAKKSEFLKEKWLIYSLSRTTGEIYLSGGSSNEKSQTITLPIIFLKLIWLLHHEGSRYNEWVTRRSSFVVSIFNNLDPRITTFFGQLRTFWPVLKGEQAVQYSSDIQIAWVQSYILNLWVFREACPSSWLAHRWRSILTTFQFSSLFFWLEKIICMPTYRFNNLFAI